MRAILATTGALIGLYALFLLLSNFGTVASSRSVEANQHDGIRISRTGTEEPQYGGTLNVGTTTVSLSAMSWDPADINWKQNHDTGMYFEQLFAADLDKSLKKGGPHAFQMRAFLPSDAIRGELAETWEWEDPLTLIVHLRRGVMFPAKPGIMDRRELTADDVAFSYYRQAKSPKITPIYLEHIDRVLAHDDHTVVFEFNSFNAEWDNRFGYGYYSGILPRELGNVDVRDWRNAVGSGPFQIHSHIEGNSQTYVRTAGYWDRETLNGKQYPIPFADKLVYRIIRDEATYLTALRTGKLDILEAIRWLAVEHLRETTPELRWSRYLSTVGTFVALRMDQKLFNDVRVRRAMNLAVNQREIVENFHGGQAELFAYPQKPAFIGYYEPLEAMPESVQELFSYNPEKARRLLAEAGYPDGFEFTIQVSASSKDHTDMLPLIVDYLSKVGVKASIEPLEYTAFLSAMTTRTHSSARLSSSGHGSPITTLRKSFLTGHSWNMSQFSDPEVDARLVEVLQERDESRRQEIIKTLTVEILDLAPYIWLPTPYVHAAWWPWVKNYNGELYAGAVRPGPIYARLWIDREMKREMGFE